MQVRSKALFTPGSSAEASAGGMRRISPTRSGARQCVAHKDARGLATHGMQHTVTWLVVTEPVTTPPSGEQVPAVAVA